MIVFKSWPEFLSFTGTSAQRLEIAINSSLFTKSTSPHRKSVWMALIDSEYFTEVKGFYEQLIAMKKFTLAEGMINRIREDINTFIGCNLNESTKIVRILGAYIRKNSEFVYSYEVSFVAHAILGVFLIDAEAFAVFSYIIEKVFPQDYFTELRKDTQQNVYSQAFCDLVGKMRKKITAVFIPATKSKFPSESDKFVFESSMKSLCTSWYKSLLSSLLYQSDVYRVWDNIFLYGFDFVQKFALGLLSEFESAYLKNLSEEVTATGLMLCGETLIYSANSLKYKILGKKQSVDVEKIIVKVMSKPNYTAINYKILVPEAHLALSNSEQRINRLRSTQSVMDSTNFSLQVSLRFIRFLNTLDDDGKITLANFLSISLKYANIQTLIALSFFITFDQDSEFIISVYRIKIGLALITPQLDNKLMLFFEATMKKSRVSLKRFLRLVFTIEELIDNGNTSYRKCLKGYLKGEGVLKTEGFIRIFKETKLIQPLVRMLEYIDGRNTREYPNLRNFSFESIIEVDFSHYSTVKEKKALELYQNLSTIVEEYKDDPSIEISEKSYEDDSIDYKQSKSLSLLPSFTIVSEKSVGDEESYNNLSSVFELNEITRLNLGEGIDSSKDTIINISNVEDLSSANITHPGYQLDIPTIKPAHTNRNCSRLCSTNNCHAF